LLRFVELAADRRTFVRLPLRLNCIKSVTLVAQRSSESFEAQMTSSVQHRPIFQYAKSPRVGAILSIGCGDQI